MAKQILTVPSNGVDFYCEKRGSGPVLVFVPGGSSDCEQFSIVGDLLADEFTVLTFDMRGGTRSMPKVNQMVTPKLLATDVVGILKALDMAPASICGCSSGGQATLALGKLYPEVAKNLIVHEAALMTEGPLPNAGFDFFKAIYGTYGPVCHGFSPRDVVFVCDKKKWDAFGPEFLKRVELNNEYWSKWFLGSVDVDTYSEEDLARMPNLEFSIGAWTPTWMSYANIAVANRGNKPYTWLNCSHYPHATCPEEFAAFVRKTCKKYI